VARLIFQILETGSDRRVDLAEASKALTSIPFYLETARWFLNEPARWWPEARVRNAVSCDRPQQLRGVFSRMETAGMLKRRRAGHMEYRRVESVLWDALRVCIDRLSQAGVV
jgi:hypothetical protein